MTRDTDRPSYWLESSEFRSRDAALEPAPDVAVVGAGVVGLTAAYLLQREGKSVLVLDRLGLATRDSGRTTAHLSFVVDTPVRKLTEKHGEQAARRAWGGNAFAIDFIERVSREEGIACDFARVPAYLYAARREHVEQVRRAAEDARRLGFRAEDAPVDDVPFPAEAALRFPEQGRVHPLKYLTGLAERFLDAGGRVADATAVEHVEEAAGGARLHLAGGGDVTAREVVLATHVPTVAHESPYSRVHAFRSYVLGARIPRGSVPDALYWDTEDPFHYTRLQPLDGRHDLLVFGGADHASGSEKARPERWDRLEGTLRQSLDVDFEVAWRWSAEDHRTEDGLPFIGRDPSHPARPFIATGFDGSGITYGTLAGWMIAEGILGRSTPYDDLFSPARLDEGARRERTESDGHHMKKHEKEMRRRARDVGAVRDLKPGEGAVVILEGEPLAVHRDEAGQLAARSAKCRHLGCIVAWNAAESSWDCPCHGSRYAPTGEVLDGPTHHALGEADRARLHAALEAARREARTVRG